MNQDGQQVLETRLIHTSGEWISAVWLLPSDATPQQMGSALTYGRRYTATALLGIAPDEDDDGKAASKTPRQAPRKPAESKTNGQAPSTPKRQITLLVASDGSEEHFPATGNGVIAAIHRLDQLLEEDESNWQTNREVAMRMLATAPSLAIADSTVKDVIDEYVLRFEGVVP